MLLSSSKFIENLDNLKFLREVIELTGIGNHPYPGLLLARNPLESFQHLNFIVNEMPKYTYEYGFDSEGKAIIIKQKEIKYIIMLDRVINSRPFLLHIGDCYIYDVEKDLIIKKMEFKFRNSIVTPFSYHTIEKFYNSYKINVDEVHLGFFNTDIMNKQIIPYAWNDFFVRTAFSEEFIEDLKNKIKSEWDLINLYKPTPELSKYVLNEKILKPFLNE